MLPPRDAENFENLASDLMIRVISGSPGLPDFTSILLVTLHYITLHYITLHYITLHYITLHYIALH